MTRITIIGAGLAGLGQLLSEIAVSELAPRSWRYWRSLQGAAR